MATMSKSKGIDVNEISDSLFPTSLNHHRERESKRGTTPQSPQTPQCPQSHRLHSRHATLSPQVSTDSKLAGASSENATVLQCRASQLGIVTGQPPEPKKLKSWTVSLLFDVLQNWNCFSALNFKTPFLGSFRQQQSQRPANSGKLRRSSSSRSCAQPQSRLGGLPHPLSPASSFLQSPVSCMAGAAIAGCRWVPASVASLLLPRRRRNRSRNYTPHPKPTPRN